MIATRTATPSEAIAALYAASFNPPSSTNSVRSGSTAKIELERQ